MTPQTASDLRSRWLTWALVGVAMLSYAVPAEVESYTVMRPLALTPGQEVDLTLVRLFENPLQLDIVFHAPGCEQRPELGYWPPGSERGGMVRGRPGATVRIEASTDDAPAPVTFEAMPASAFCNGNLRKMTTGGAVQPGVYRWPPPPDAPSVVLHPGLNQVRLKVAAADPPLAGETVDVYALGALGLTAAAPNVAYLWPALFLDLVFAVVQALWLLLLLRWTWAFRRRRRRAAAAP